jgi:hypothetical protein
MSKKAKSLLDQVPVATPGAQKKSAPSVVLSSAQKTLVDLYCDAARRFKEAETEKEQLGAEVKLFAREKFSENAAQKGEPTNMKFQGDDGSINYIVMKRFGAVSEEQKTVIEAAGFGEFVEKSQIQLQDGLTGSDQERILKALAKEFGTERALQLVRNQYVVNPTALEAVAAEGKVARVQEAIQFLRPVEQLRTTS